MSTIRRLVIFVAQILALVFIVLATLAGALLGDGLLGDMPILGTMIALTSAKGISFLGALAGFFISTTLVALFFLLVEIAYNTRNPFSS